MLDASLIAKPALTFRVHKDNVDTVLTRMTEAA